MLPLAVSCQPGGVEWPELPGRWCEPDGDDCDGRCDAVEDAAGDIMASLCAPPCDWGTCLVLDGVCDDDGACVVPCHNRPCLWGLECYLVEGERRCLRGS